MANEDRYQGRNIRFGIVGCGAIGPTHAGAIQQIDDADLVAVADTVADRARAMADKFGSPKVYADQHEVFADPNVDVVCLCTPSGMHADGAVAALRAGKHVIVEKPMEISLEACDRMIAAERESGRTLTVISQHRFDPASMLVKQLIDGGKLGKIILATAEVKWWRTQKYYDSGEWRGTWKFDGGGALMNQGVHTVDLLQWLTGGVASVFGQVRTSAHDRIEVEDIATASLTFRSGAVGTIVASTAAYDGLPVRIDIFGTDGSAILEGDRLKLVTLKTGETYASEEAAAHALSVAKGGTASVRDEAAHREAAAGQGQVWGDAHRAQIQDFIRAIRTGGKPLIDARSGRDPVEIILSVYESARSGKPLTLTSKK
ncbi:MAG TPA: Gfo/Idh/MocA family oxidoreductase [Tepidisphaeraceae bacterium]|nr:Gfo/Idh/MocA family oxidoreductase [Tepidisphaeraceae bacterium]